MIDLYTWQTPNGRKASIGLEEFGLDYETHPIDIAKDEQFAPEFLAISPNNKIPAIVDRDTGTAMMESGAILLYLADKTGMLMPGDEKGRWKVMEWLMMQMGSVGPMLGQTHHFARFNEGKAPYAEERFLKETKRIYGVLDRRLGEAGLPRGRRLQHRRHRHLALDLALRVAPDRLGRLPQPQALVSRHRRPPGGAARLRRAQQGAGDPASGVGRRVRPGRGAALSRPSRCG